MNIIKSGGQFSGEKVGSFQAKKTIPNNYNILMESYPSIYIPILLIWGMNDIAIPIDTGKKLNSILPNSELVVFDNCGHIPHEEKPEEAYTAMYKFIEL